MLFKVSSLLFCCLQTQWCFKISNHILKPTTLVNTFTLICVYIWSLWFVYIYILITLICEYDHFDLWIRSLRFVNTITLICEYDHFDLWIRSLWFVNTITEYDTITMICEYDHFDLCIRPLWFVNPIATSCRGCWRLGPSSSVRVGWTDGRRLRGRARLTFTGQLVILFWMSGTILMASGIIIIINFFVYTMQFRDCSPLHGCVHNTNNNVNNKSSYPGILYFEQN